jgi:TonB family protein
VALLRRWCVFGWLLVSNPAHAENTEKIVPPAAEQDTHVPYPAEASGDAVVVLELVVAADGHVDSVTVVAGAPPFAEAAMNAARSWRFRPARQGEVAVAARIRVQVEFHPDVTTNAAAEGPAVAASPPPSPLPPTPASVPTAPNDEELAPVEVSVDGERPVAGQTTLSAAEVRVTPGAFGDAFRAVEVLPGVTPALGGIPYFFVRGMPPNDHGYFLDGVRVPLLFHVGLGPAVIHPGLLERVDFYPGSAPASHGGFTGALIQGRTREPAAVAHGEAHLRLVDAGGLLETPLFDDKATLLIAGRYGYPGPIVSAISDTTLDYWDYQARATWRASNSSTLGVLAFGSHDTLGQIEPSGEKREDLASDFHRIDLRFDQRVGDGTLRVGSSFGYDSQGADPTYLRNRSIEPRIELDQRFSESVRLRAGIQTRLDVYAIKREEPAPDESIVPSTADPPRTNLTGAVYSEVAWQPSSHVELVPGVRFTVFDSKRPASDAESRAVRTTVPAVDPRFSSRVGLATGVAWLATAGMSHQYPALRVGALPAVIAAGSGFPVGSERLQRTIQQSQGIEVELPAAAVVTLTGFTSWSWGMTDLTRECIRIEPPSAPVGEGPRPEDPFFCPSNAPVKGRAYGLELLLRRQLTERIGGLLSYTLSRAERQSHFVTLQGEDAVANVPSDFDRTHVLNFILTGDLGRRWRAGGRFVFYSGVPYSPLSGNVPVPPYNSRRDPPYYRADFRVEKRWALGTDGAIALVFEVLNATLSKEANTLGMDCTGNMTSEEYTTQCRRGTVGPLTLPSIGVEAFF